MVSTITTTTRAISDTLALTADFEKGADDQTRAFPDTVALSATPVVSTITTTTRAISDTLALTATLKREQMIRPGHSQTLLLFQLLQWFQLSQQQLGQFQIR